MLTEWILIKLGSFKKIMNLEDFIEQLDINIIYFYEHLLLGPMTAVYSGMKKNPSDEVRKFAYLLIDKYAIQSSSFFFLSKGIIELKKTSDEVKVTGYDLFTCNSTFRTILETYTTFHNIFMESKSKDEEEFRFLLWKIDGLLDKQNLNIKPEDFEEAQSVLDKDAAILSDTRERLEQNNFYKSLPFNESKKLYKPGHNRVNWRFIIRDNLTIVPLKITELISHSCKMRSFTNLYKYTSMHTHTGYLSIEHFIATRGIHISERQVKPSIKLASFLTCLLIMDMHNLDERGKEEFHKLDLGMQNIIVGISDSIRHSNYS